MKNKPRRKSKGRTDFRMSTIRRQMCESLRPWNAIAATDNIFDKKKEYSYYRYPNSVYFNIPLLIIYLINYRNTYLSLQKLCLIGLTSFGFAQNTLHDFQKYGIELIMTLSSINATKKEH